MPHTKGSKEAKEFMEKVRKSKKSKQLKELNKSESQDKSNQQDNSNSKDKTQLLIDIVMELQKDIDYLLVEHEKLKKMKTKKA